MFYYYLTNFYNLISRTSFRWLHYILLPLRFKIKVVGQYSYLDQKTDPQGGFLFLSNHPSHLDAALIATYLLKANQKITIWTVDYVFKNPYARLVSHQVDTTKLLKVPNAHENRHSKNSRRIRALIRRTVVGLQKGENFLFFPGGSQKYSAREEISGKSAVQRILRQYPNVNIVLVRITGLWGSRFTKAAKKSERSLLKENQWLNFVGNILKMFLFNLIFFIPKRKVLIEFAAANASFPRTGTRKEINAYLENYFNNGFGYAGEPLQRVPLYFWKNSYIPNEYHERDYVFDLSKIPPSILLEVKKAIALKASITVDQIDVEARIDRDLSLDSLEIADLLTDLESKYQMPKYIPKNITTVGHLAAIVSGIPIQRILRSGEFPSVKEEPAPGLKAIQTCSAWVLSFLTLLHLNK